MDSQKIARIRNELTAVGVGSVGLITPESKALAKILEPNEHIGGAIYGRYTGGLAWLVATDQRVIFLDHKLLHTTTDELTYDVVSGVRSNHNGPFSSVTLHTRINDYTIRFVNAKSASTFIKFIETRRLESGDYNQSTYRYTQGSSQPLTIQNQDEQAVNFLKEHDLAVLSTVDRTGNVHGAVVYYIVDQQNLVYILTKSDTGKARNVYAHGQVALTVHEPGTMQTVQLQGVAEVETDQKKKDTIFETIIKPRTYREGIKLPPVTKLHHGAFVIIRINPSFISYHDYDKLE